MYWFTKFLRQALDLKIILWQNRSTHISDIFSSGCAFQGNYPMCWCPSLVLKTAVRNSHLFNQVFSTFPTYCGKFLCLSHYPYIQQSVINHLANSDITFKHPIKAKTQMRFMVLFTSRSSSTWRESHGTTPPGISWLSICNKSLFSPLQKYYNVRIWILHPTTTICNSWHMVTKLAPSRATKNNKLEY